MPTCTRLSPGRRKFLFRGTLAVALLATTLLAWNHHAERQAQRLEAGIGKIGAGTPAALVNEFIGSPPDQLTRSDGVVAYGSLFLAAQNEHALRHGKPAPHELRTWKRGPATALVIIDDNGRVVGRSVTRPRRSNSFTAALAKLHRLIRRAVNY